MMYLITSLIVTTLFASTQGILLDLDAYDCTDQHADMDVRVEVDQHSVLFSPSCNFTLDETFTTPEGVQCTLSSGMCSPFEERSTLTLSCDDGRKTKARFPCPRQMQKTLLDVRLGSSLDNRDPLPTRTMPRKTRTKRRKKRRYTPKKP